MDTKYPLAFFSYIAESFGKNIDSQVRAIHHDTGVCGSAMPVDIFINIAQDYAEKGYDHAFLKKVFSVNREVRLSDVTSGGKITQIYDLDRTNNLLHVAEGPPPYDEN